MDASRIHRLLGQTLRISLFLAQQVAEASLNQMSSHKRVICVTHVYAVCSVCMLSSGGEEDTRGCSQMFCESCRSWTIPYWSTDPLLINSSVRSRGNGDQIVVRAIRSRMADPTVSKIKVLQQFGRAIPSHFHYAAVSTGSSKRQKVIHAPSYLYFPECLGFAPTSTKSVYYMQDL